MLWFRSESELFKCVNEFNAGCGKPENKIRVRYGANFFKFRKRKVGKEIILACVGFNEVNVEQNRNFVMFMNCLENRDYLDTNTPHPLVM